jgi:hypothetical protein
MNAPLSQFARTVNARFVNVLRHELATIMVNVSVRTNTARRSLRQWRTMREQWMQVSL